MPQKTRLGGKVRALRRHEKLSQVDLADQLAISPSYLNLIEHDQRQLTAPLLLKLAEIFKLDLTTFAADSEARLLANLREVFADDLFRKHELDAMELRELSANPAVAHAVIALYQAYQASREAARALAARLSDGSDLLGPDPARLPSEEVSEVIQRNMNHFPALESAAERVAHEAGLDREISYAGLVRYLEERHDIRVVVSAVAEDRQAVRRFDAERRQLTISEVLPPSSRSFQVAHQTGLLTQRPELDRIIATSHLTTPDSVSLCRVALANYFAAALLMPYEPFRAAAEALRYDIELLSHRFRAGFEQVCHRLTTLQRPGAEGIPLHMIRVDIAGNISKRFSGSGIRFARFSGSCPRWNVHAAFMSPGTIRTQVSRMPDGTTYFCVARTIRRNRSGYGVPQPLLAVGLGCEVRHARRMVYADGIDLANLETAVPVGTTCRLCERIDCGQRAFPAIQYRLSIDENVRGISFYAPAAVTA